MMARNRGGKRWTEIRLVNSSEPYDPYVPMGKLGKLKKLNLLVLHLNNYSGEKNYFLGQDLRGKEIWRWNLCSLPAHLLSEFAIHLGKC